MTNKIAVLNDALRRTGVGGKTVVSRGVSELPDHILTKVIEAARDFSDFNEDNDPYGEHDCAFFEVEGQKFMFKIDYYDNDLQFGSEDPSDPTITTRVMTILKASEY